MRILSIANISNVDDLEADSGIVFQRVIGKKLVDYGHRYTLIAPKEISVLSGRFEGIPIVELGLGVGRYSSRFAFDWNGITEVIVREKPDVVFVNQIELTGAVKAALVSADRPHTRLVAYCHYPPATVLSRAGELDKSLDQHRLGGPILYDVAGAMHVADLIIVQSQYARDLLVAATENILVRPSAPIAVIPPPRDTELDPHPHERPTGQPNAVLYNHRLYESYGTKHFIDFLARWNRTEIQLRVADPMANRSKEREKLSTSPRRMLDAFAEFPFVSFCAGSTNRREYRDILQASRIAFAPYRQGCVWSMSVVDCLSWGIPVVAPNIAAYPEFVPKRTLFDTWEEAASILDELVSSADEWESASIGARGSVQSLAAENIARRIEQALAGDQAYERCVA